MHADIIAGLTGIVLLQAELGAELAQAWGALYSRRLDVSRQQLLAADRSSSSSSVSAGEATSVPDELKCASGLAPY